MSLKLFLISIYFLREERRGTGKGGAESEDMSISMYIDVD